MRIRPASTSLFIFSGPVQNGNVLWLGAAKPNSTRQNSFTLANTGAAGSTLSVALPVLAGRSIFAARSRSTGSTLSVALPVLAGPDAAKFTLVNAADFPLGLAANQSHALTLSCTPTTLGPLNATLTLATNDHNQAGTNFGFQLKCAGGYAVTVAPDNGDSGTLSQILGNFAINAGDAVVFDLPDSAHNRITLNAATAAKMIVKAGVQIDAGCNGGPPVTVDGGNFGGSFKLSGNDWLRGLAIRDFAGSGPQLLTLAPGNVLDCTKIQK